MFVSRDTRLYAGLPTSAAGYNGLVDVQISLSIARAPLSGAFFVPFEHAIPHCCRPERDFNFGG